MKIIFGTTPKNSKRAVFFGCILGFAFTVCYFELIYTLDDAHDALLESLTPNTTSTNVRLLCGIRSYDDCRCSTQSAKNVYLKNCLTDNFLLWSRMFPLVSFILQVCLIQDLFTLSGKYTRIVVYCLWAIAVFIFLFMVNGVYQNSCFQRIIIVLAYGTGGVLFLLVVSDIRRQQDLENSRFNRRDTFKDHIITNGEAPEEIINDKTFEVTTK